ncbi:hypothetical protein CAEBREN_12903 [Caenorhabditis brenneri]|uniref:Uncharacterized protein n=1 Tax=Caenorhabditis brenneri TaxID=135651 RepID=G0NV03_CAEBE|nr:hypothetical protein CAEBREN_12903 [Caenorhabditis brenneri]
MMEEVITEVVEDGTIIIIHITGVVQAMEEDLATTQTTIMEVEEADSVLDVFFSEDYSEDLTTLIIQTTTIMDTTTEDTVEFLNSLIMSEECLDITVIVHHILQIINGINAFQCLLMERNNHISNDEAN